MCGLFFDLNTVTVIFIRIWLRFSCDGVRLPKINNKEVDMKIITQRQAIELGLTRFYTGRACVHGHDSERYSISGECVQCNHDRARRQAMMRSEKLKAARLARGVA